MHPHYQNLAAEAVSEYNKLIYDTLIQRDTALLKRLVDNLEQGGVKVYLFEMPVSPEITRTRFCHTTRSEIASLFSPDHTLLLDYKIADLYWPDGQHLDNRSALIVTGALERAVTDRIESTRVK